MYEQSKIALLDTRTRHLQAEPSLQEADIDRFYSESSPKIHVLYQPIIDLQKEKVVRVEGLVRFQDQGQLISPDKVLPFLHQEAVTRINFSVLKQAARDLRLWKNLGLNFKVSINVEIYQMENPNFAHTILRILGRENISPQDIALEILEGNDLEISTRMMDQMRVLRQEKMTFSLDDVGSAYSGLTRIKNLPVDSLKLDGGFVRDLHQKPDDLTFIQALSALSRSLGKAFIVEGVEDAALLNALRRLDVTLIQGYVFSRPISAEEIPQYICNLRIPRHSDVLQPGDWIGAYAEILHERERLTAMLRHAPEMLDRRYIKKQPDEIMESCLLLTPHIYQLYCQQRMFVSQAAGLHPQILNAGMIDKIEQGYRTLLLEIEKQIPEVNHEKPGTHRYS